MNKEKLLLIMPFLPYPERKDGLTIRYNPIIKRLSEVYDIDGVIILSTESLNETNRLAISPYFNELKVIDHFSRGKVSIYKKICSLISYLNIFSPPHTVYSYYLKENISVIMDLYKSNQYKKVIFATMRNSHELDCLVKMGLAREKIVVDIIDSWLLHHSRGGGAKSLLGRFRFQKSINWERRVVRNSSAVMYISQKDKDFSAKYIGKFDNTFVSPNGIHMADYHNNVINGDDKTPVIGFLGNMSYPPNISGAQFAAQVYKEYVETVGPLKYHIIGRDPVPEILSLSNDPNIVVTGTVDDIWMYVNAVDIFLINLFEGAGQQNKILEIMYAAKPVIVNAVSNSGIGAVHNEHLVIAASKSDCVRYIAELVKDQVYRHKLGESGKEFVINKYGWDTTFKQYLNILLNNDQ